MQMSLRLREQIEELKDFDTDPIIYDKKQALDPHLGIANPYAINRKLGLIADILEGLERLLERT